MLAFRTVTYRYTDPEVAWVGLTEDQAKQRDIKVQKACSPGRPQAAPLPTAATRRPSCCSTAAPMDQETATHHGKILGGGMVGTHAGDMIGEIALAIEMGADAVDIDRPSTRIRRWARASAWRRKWRMAAARMCRLRASSPQPSYPDKARTGDGSGLVLCVPKQSPQNTVHLYGIHVSHFKPKLYNPRHPERAALQMVAEHYETWLELASAGQFDSQGDHHTPSPSCAKRLPSILSAASLPHGFARARCGDCGHDYFSLLLQRPGSLPLVHHAADGGTAHLNDHVSPPAGAPVGALGSQRGCGTSCNATGGAEHGAAHLSAGDRTNLQTHSPGAAHMDKAGLHIGAIAFIHRFGSSLNEHVHFHVCVVDGVFEEVEARAMLMRPPRISSPGVIFHAATGIDAATVAPVQTTLQKRILRAFVLGACWRTVTPKTCWATNTAVSRWTPVSASEAHDRQA